MLPAHTRPRPGALLLVVAVAATAAVHHAHAYVEVVRDAGCHNTQLRLTCRQLEASIAILETHFSPDAGTCPPDNVTGPAVTWTTPAGVTDVVVDSTPPDHATLEEQSPYVVRPALNRRCSGRNTCNFLLIEDLPGAAAWGPGRLFIKYACADRSNVTRACTRDVLLADGGGTFLQTPAYPSYYVGGLGCHWRLRAPPGKTLQLSLLDVSLRDRAPHEDSCRDVLRVSEAGRTLLETCGELPRLVRLCSGGPELVFSVLTTSKTLYARRGVLAHFVAVGCGEPPEAPADGYRVTSNGTHAQYMCCVGFAFAETMEREVETRCDARKGAWVPSPLPECVNATFNTWNAMRLNEPMNNETSLDATAVPKDSDLMIDILLPTMIICVLLLGNGVIIFVILYLRKRKVHGGADEELGAICQPQDTASVSDRAICV